MEKYGQLTVTSSDVNIGGDIYVYCDCECGTKHFLVLKEDLLNRTVTSCGHEQYQSNPRYVDPSTIKPSQYKHGDSVKSSLYYNSHHIWQGMRRMCNNPNDKSYNEYGGSGIKVCKEWDKPVEGYENFKEWSLKNGYELGKTIDRKDNLRIAIIAILFYFFF